MNKKLLFVLCCIESNFLVGSQPIEPLRSLELRQKEQRLVDLSSDICTLYDRTNNALIGFQYGVFCCDLYRVTLDPSLTVEICIESLGKLLALQAGKLLIARIALNNIHDIELATKKLSKIAKRIAKRKKVV